MKIKVHGWVHGFAVRPLKSERQLVVVLRASEDEIPPDAVKMLTSSVSKEGTKCQFVFTELTEDKSAPGDVLQMDGLIRTIRVASTTDGKFVELRLAMPEGEIVGSNYETLSAAIRGAQEPSVEVSIEPLHLRQVEAFPAAANE